MKLRSSSLILLFAFWMVILCGAAMAQRTSGGSKPGTTVNTPPPRVSNPTDTTVAPTIISGKVLLQGGGPPPGPVAIERVCNGTARREGYTDSKGQFQIQIGQNPEFQDASESNSSLTTPDRASASRIGQDARRQQLQGCEFRALLAGFQSTAVMFRAQGSSWQFDLGTIFLSRLDNVKGATISTTTLSAPGEARHAFEKAQRSFAQEKFPDAEKELTKAVQIYPNFAAAWSMLGDVQQRTNRLDDAAQSYSHSMSADPQFVSPVFGLALVAMQQKRWLDAVQFSEQTIKLNPFAFPAAFFYNAVANYTLGRMAPAEESARKFKPLDNEHHHPDVSLLLSNILVRKGDYAGAAQELRDYLVLAPNAPNAEEIRTQAQKFEEMSVAKKQ